MHLLFLMEDRPLPMSADHFQNVFLAETILYFPTGKGSRYGITTVLGVSDGTWEGEYFNSGYSSLAVTAPLTAVSSTEYWHITGPAGKQAYVKLRWDPSSDITPLTTQNGISDIRVAEYNTGTSRWIEETTAATGDNI